MNNNILLSLCIPTYGVVEWVVPLVESIYSQDCDNNIFEVVITDNGKGSKLGEVLTNYSFPNLHYYRTTSEGFTNQIDAFQKSNGLFRKMLNHRSRLLDGALKKMLDVITKYQSTKPILYFSNGILEDTRIIECNSVDIFCSKMSYYISWSMGTGVWRDDLDKLDKSKISRMFPHFTLLFYLRNQSRFVICNEEIEMQDSGKGKGGYDLFNTFAVVFLDEVNRLRVEGRITDITFAIIKKGLLKFLSGLYCNEYLGPYTIYNFIIRNVKRSMCRYYSCIDYVYFLFLAWRKLPRRYFHCARILNKNVFNLLYNRMRNGIIHDVN